MLGARALKRDDIFQFGLDILEGCWHSYNVTPTGISPERTSMNGILTNPKYGNGKVTIRSMNHPLQSPVTNGINTHSGHQHETITSVQVSPPPHPPPYQPNGENTKTFFLPHRAPGKKIYQK